MGVDEEISPAQTPVHPDDAGWFRESTFREAAANLTARLLRRYGAHQLDRVEDAVQDAFVAAARRWPLAGTPAEPLAWLSRVAQRRYLDRVRAAKRLVPDEGQADAVAASDITDDLTDDDTSVLADDQLRLLFMCCHPSLSAESRVALTLKCVAQLSVNEIARLLRADATAVAQRLVRAKRTLRESRATFTVPPERELAARLDDVLTVCYALFAEGHLATSGETAVRRALCDEAMRLVALLRAHAKTARADTHALAALMYLTAARFPARESAAVLVPLGEQDRSRWSAALRSRGLEAFAMSASGTVMTRYHVEAEIAVLHTTAAAFDRTPWPEIIAAYDRLLRIAPSPVARLSRVVAVAESGDVASAYRQARALAEEKAVALEEWPDLHATIGALAARLSLWPDAVAAYDRALAMDSSVPVRQYWTQQRDRAQVETARVQNQRQN